MITTTESPAWLRRSDQAVSWARTMLQPHRAVVIDCATTDLPGAITGRVGYQNLCNRRPATCGSVAIGIDAPNTAGFQRIALNLFGS